MNYARVIRGRFARKIRIQIWKMKDRPDSKLFNEQRWYARGLVKSAEMFGLINERQARGLEKFINNDAPMKGGE